MLKRLLSAAILAFCATPALAQSSATKPGAPEPQASTLTLAYSIAFWGIPFGDTDYEGRFTPSGYSVRSHFQTTGIVSAFWNANIDATANGGLSVNGLSPNEYDSFYRRSEDKKERVKVTFTNGDPETFADPPYNMKLYPVSDEEKREAVDPMSAITLVLSGVKADAANPCGTVAPVFDGRRRYDMTFVYLKDEPLKLGNGLFNGRAHLCQIRYKQIAGFKPKILKEGAAFPPMYADFGDVPAPGAPKGRYVIALKLWSHLNWGTVSADLTALHTN